jgi:hypothetical protein
MGTAAGALLGSGALSVGAALGRTGAGGGGSGSGSGSTLAAAAAAEAASGTSADAEGAGGATDAASKGRAGGLSEAEGAADTGAGGALGALSARTSGTPSKAPNGSANRLKKASRSPQTRAHIHEYDEDLTLGLEASATGKATARLSIAPAAYRTLGRRSHGENS